MSFSVRGHLHESVEHFLRTLYRDTGYAGTTVTIELPEPLWVAYYEEAMRYASAEHKTTAWVAGEIQAYNPPMLIRRKKG